MNITDIYKKIKYLLKIKEEKKKKNIQYNNFINEVEKDKEENYNQKDINLNEQNNTQIIIHDISISAIIKVVFIMSIFFVFSNAISLLGTLLFIVIISIIISSAIDPVADRFENKGIPRVLTVIGIYIIFFIIIGFVFSNIIPLFAMQISELAKYIEYIFNKENHVQDTISNFLNEQLNNIVDEKTKLLILEQLKNNLTNFATELLNITKNTIGIAGNIFTYILYFFTILILTLYMVIDKKATEYFIRSISPKDKEEYVLSIIDKIKKKMGSWVRGQLILSFLIGILVYITLYFIGIKYALLIAIIAGICELIPMIGFWISFIVAILFAFLQSFWAGIITAIAFVIIQSLEGNIIVPLVMKHSVGLSPVAVILAMLAGVQLFGIAGLILAVPVTGILSILINEYFKK